ncbi:MAG: radical SAM protein [Bacilli bacterium]|nr:radical SAM protein [Bacilli bacterium]MBN2877917.1 radical SAM protein [Bacilli bacterium]
MEEIIAKTILQKNKPSYDGWIYHDYNMNLYRGCSHGCIYCDSRSLCYGIDNFDQVRPKKDALKILEEELMKKRKKGIVAMGSMSDPYNPLEKKLELTRGALKLFLKYGFGTSIITKSHLIMRDIDLLKEINKHHSVIVNITITTADPNLQKIIEPRSSTTIERFEALKALHEAGIHAGITLMPILPFINDTIENLDALIDLSKQYHVEHIFPWFGMTCRDRQRDYFYQKLDEHFPGIKQKYIKQFGSNYQCPVPNAKKLYDHLDKRCMEIGIRTKINNINKAFVKIPQQISFDL